VRPAHGWWEVLQQLWRTARAIKMRSLWGGE
jgi:hypothetical protein